MLLSEDHRAVQDAVRAYVQDCIAPQAARWDKEHHFPAAELRGLAELGCYGVAVPTEYGGAGLSTLAYVVALEEICYADASVGVTMSVNNSLVCWPILGFGNEAQKQKYLPDLATGKHLGCYALTEPNAGSDAGAQRSKAVKNGENYLLNGNKVLAQYTVHLGGNPVGHKQFEGDGKTPEGQYRISHRNPRSQYHLSLGISYPNDRDRAFAASKGKQPGGDIFIPGGPPRPVKKHDWTAGCIAVSDEEMEVIYSMVKPGTPIFIRP